jgi:AcrR family transcriptional regulator
VAGKREAQKAKREHLIFVAACDLFAKAGYEATGMDDIAERAGLSVGTLYNYFESKSDVLLRVLDGAVAAMVAESTPVLRNPPPLPRRGLDKLASIWIRHMARERGLWRNLWAAALQHPDPYGAGYFKIDAILTERFADLVTHYQYRGLLRDNVPPAQAASVFYAFYSQAVMAFLWDSRITERRLLAECRAASLLILQGVAVGPASHSDS